MNKPFTLTMLTSEQFGQMILQLTDKVSVPVVAWEQAGSFMMMADGLASGELAIVSTKAAQTSSDENK